MSSRKEKITTTVKVPEINNLFTEANGYEAKVEDVITVLENLGVTHKTPATGAINICLMTSNSGYQINVITISFFKKIKDFIGTPYTVQLRSFSNEAMAFAGTALNFRYVDNCPIALNNLLILLKAVQLKVEKENYHLGTIKTYMRCDATISYTRKETDEEVTIRLAKQIVQEKKTAFETVAECKKAIAHHEQSTAKLHNKITKYIDKWGPEIAYDAPEAKKPQSKKEVILSRPKVARIKYEVE